MMNTQPLNLDFESSAIAGPEQLARVLSSYHTVTDEVDPSFMPKFSAWLRTMGFETRIILTGHNQHLACSIGPSSSPKLRVAFVGHYDTVPLGAGWSYAPLGGEEVSGRLYGRGVADMKSGVAAMVFAAHELASEGVYSTIFIPGDEETTSEGMPALLESESYVFDLCIGGEPTSKEVLGDCLKIGRRGRIVGSVTLHGKAGHAAYAEMTPNIVHRLPSVIEALGAPWNDTSGGTATTLSITNIASDNSASNVIPGNVTISFDTRSSPRRCLDDVESEIKARLAQTGVPHTLCIIRRTSPYLTDTKEADGGPNSTGRNAKLVACAVQTIKDLSGVTPQVTCDGGTSDARFIAVAGVPTIEFGVPHGNMHGPDEFVEVASISLLRDIYVGILRGMI
jgi:succinyl-diaminopimelate desuccinylase